MEESSDILTLGWGDQSGGGASAQLWSGGEEFVTLEETNCAAIFLPHDHNVILLYKVVGTPTETHEYVTLEPSDWSILRLEDTLRGSPPSVAMGGHLAPPPSLPVPSPLTLSSASPLSLHHAPNGLGGNSLPSPFSHQPSAGGYLNLGGGSGNLMSLPPVTTVPTILTTTSQMSYQDFCLDATTVQPATLFSPWLDPAAGPQYQPTTAVAVHTLQPGGVFTMTTTPPTSLLAPPTFSTVALGGVSTPTVSTSSTYQGQSAYFTPGNQLVDIKHPTAVRMNIHTPTPIVPTSPINLNSNNVTSVNTQSPAPPKKSAKERRSTKKSRNSCAGGGDGAGGGEGGDQEYDPELIANAHLNYIDEHYVCSVCGMRFKQPGNARRHIITVHRNEKPHICMKCDAKFGRKDKLKTHMMRNHGYTVEDIKATFKHSGQGRQRSSILVNRENRNSTDSLGSSDGFSPMNLKLGRPSKKKM